jgi:hypothetical protein
MDTMGNVSRAESVRKEACHQPAVLSHQGQTSFDDKLVFVLASRLYDSKLRAENGCTVQVQGIEPQSVSSLASGCFERER